MFRNYVMLVLQAFVVVLTGEVVSVVMFVYRSAVSVCARSLSLQVNPTFLLVPGACKCAIIITNLPIRVLCACPHVLVYTYECTRRLGSAVH